MVAQPPAPPRQNESLADTGRKLLNNRHETSPAVRHPTRKTELVPNIPRATAGPPMPHPHDPPPFPAPPPLPPTIQPHLSRHTRPPRTLDDNVDGESEKFSNSKSSASWCCLGPA